MPVLVQEFIDETDDFVVVQSRTGEHRGIQDLERPRKLGQMGGVQKATL